jgi:hypothetical protein
MEPQPIDKQDIEFNTFIFLIFGLDEITRTKTSEIPNNIRRALNHLAYEMSDNFPRTFSAFINLCHQPIDDWYPLPCPKGFYSQAPLLDQGELTDAAQEFCFEMTEHMQLSSTSLTNISQTMIDNLEMVKFRQNLKNNSDQEASQTTYVRVRSFIIENSWASIDQLRKQTDIFSDLRRFYEAIESYDDLIVCERCGLLENINGEWVGLKPHYCSDHGSGSPYLQTINNTGKLFRLKRGIHLRTFIPGQIELNLFELADEFQEEYPDHLIHIQRYPRLDTYDLRLTFSDGEIWAIDAKDQADPYRLGKQIYPLYGEGDLIHHQAFYVIPDQRMEEWNYREVLHQVVGAHPSNLNVLALSDFHHQLEEKLKNLSKIARNKKFRR